MAKITPPGLASVQGETQSFHFLDILQKLLSQYLDQSYHYKPGWECIILPNNPVIYVKQS